MPDECGASDSDCLAKARPRSRAAMISGEAPSLPVASAGAARAMAMLASRSPLRGATVAAHSASHPEDGASGRVESCLGVSASAKIVAIANQPSKTAIKLVMILKAPGTFFISLPHFRRLCLVARLRTPARPALSAKSECRSHKPQYQC